MRALLEVPNDPKLIDLILNGRDQKDRSKDLAYLSRRLGELGVPLPSIKTILTMADKRWGKFFDREDGEERREELLALAKEVAPQDFLQTIKPVSPSQLSALAKEVDWLIEGVLAAQTFGLITGSSGVGKSQLGIQAGISLAKGEPWLGYQTTKSRVLYSSLEMGPNELGYFNEKLNGGNPVNEATEVFHYLPVGQPLSLLTTEGRQYYLSLVDEYDVFIFDTVSSSTHLSMLDEASAPGIVDFFTLLNRQYGKTILALSHDKKDAPKSGRAEDVYGHRYLIDRCSMVLRVEKAQDALLLTFPKVRLAKEPDPMTYDRDPQTLWLSGGMPKQDHAVKVFLEDKTGKDELFG